MTFFLDGPPPPVRSADKIPSAPPVAAPVTGARVAPEPRGVFAPPAPKKKPGRSRLSLIRAAHRRVEAKRAREEEEVEAARLERVAEIINAREEPAAPAEESTMADTEKMLAEMRAHPERTYSLDEMQELRGGSKTAAYVCAGKLRRAGKIVCAERGRYQIAEGEEPGPKKKPRKAKKAAPVVEEPEAPEVDEEAAPPELPAVPPTLTEDEAFLCSVAPTPRRPVRVRLVRFEVEGELEPGELRALLEQLRATMEA